MDTFGKVELDFNRNSQNISREVYQSLNNNLEKISQVLNDEYLENLKKIEKEKRKEFDNSFNNDSWKSKVKGRDVLKNLVSKFQGFSYENLRNIIISCMAKEQHKPKGMKKVITQIIDT